jgi:hypothetical protein
MSPSVPSPSVMVRWALLFFVRPPDNAQSIKEFSRINPSPRNMSTQGEKSKDKVELELRELELKVSELEWKVKELSTPLYKKPTFWTTTIPIIIALIGVIGQSYLSSIKNAQAKLELERATKEIMDATEKKLKVKSELAVLDTELKIKQDQIDSAKNQVNSLVDAYNRVLAKRAFPDNGDGNNESEASKEFLTETTKNISRILEDNGSELLLKSTKLTVYYVPEQKNKAIEVDKLLKTKGVKSRYDIPDYSIDKVVHNEIVYYNQPQLVYCNAVQKLLKDQGFGDFNIRISSGANATNKYFKIYVVR